MTESLILSGKAVKLLKKQHYFRERWYYDVDPPDSPDIDAAYLVQFDDDRRAVVAIAVRRQVAQSALRCILGADLEQGFCMDRRYPGHNSRRTAVHARGVDRLQPFGLS